MRGLDSTLGVEGFAEGGNALVYAYARVGSVESLELKEAVACARRVRG